MNMLPTIRPCGALCALLIACAAPPGASDSDAAIRLSAGTATLRVTITNVRSSSGGVGCALFNTAAGFPGASPLEGGNRLERATAGSVVCEYPNLPAGDYAVSVYHDENSNARLDANVFGAPTEGYGATNNVLPALSAPSFVDSRVVLADGQTAQLAITLRY